MANLGGLLAGTAGVIVAVIVLVLYPNSGFLR